MIVQKLRNMDLVASRAKHSVYKQPANSDVLPREDENLQGSGPCEDGDDEAVGSDEGEGARLPSEPGSEAPCDFVRVEDVAGETDVSGTAKGSFPLVVGQLCGALPRDTAFSQFLCLSVRQASASAEDRYALSYASVHSSGFPPDATSLPPFAQMEELEVFLQPGEALAAAEQQRQFFQGLDAYKVDDVESPPDPATLGSASRTPWETRLRTSVEDLGAPLPSRTVVMEAAFHLIERRLLHIPDVGTINVKAARAFLFMASWLQRRMLQIWYEKDQLPADVVSEAERHVEEFCFILIGPGGTGKTTVLKAFESLVDYFAGPESVRKCALSNTAARLLGGDTMHALCKLPREDFQHADGKLSSNVLKRLRARWASAVAAFFDEVSMISPDQLCQSDVRT